MRRSGSGGCSCALMPDEPEATGPAGADAAHARARAGAHGPAGGSWCCSPTRTGSLWDRELDRRRPGAGPRVPAARTTRAPTRSRRRSTRCTPTRATDGRPTGRRSSRSTTSCYAVARLPWSRSTGRSRSPRSTARPRRSSCSTSWTSTATSCYHAIRAELLRRLGRAAEARDAYQAAIELTENPSERRFLQRRVRALTAQQP